MFTSQTKHKRGDMTGSRLKKAVSKRITAQFGEQPAQTAYPSNKTAEYLPKPLGEEQAASNSIWVSSQLLYLNLCELKYRLGGRSFEFCRTRVSRAQSRVTARLESEWAIHQW